MFELDPTLCLSSPLANLSHPAEQAMAQVWLDPLRPEDIKHVIRWKQDPDLCARVLAQPVRLSHEDALKWYEKNSQDPHQALMGIYVQSDEKKRCIGLARLMFIDEETGTSELGIYIGDPAFRGRGYGKPALHLLLQEGFYKRNLRKIFLKVASSNHPAIHLYEQAGFHVEGSQVAQCLNPSHHGSSASGASPSTPFDDLLWMGCFAQDWKQKHHGK